MQLYEVSPTAGVPSVWTGTRGEAHDLAKLKPARGDVRIYLWEVPTDKAALVGMINGKSPRHGDPIGAWALTNRGGLMELPLDKAMRDLADEADVAPRASGAPTPEELEEL